MREMSLGPSSLDEPDVAAMEAELAKLKVGVFVWYTFVFATCHCWQELEVVSCCPH